MGRLSESTLLAMCFVGGTPGGYFAMRVFRHKTKKASFQFQFYLVMLAQLCGLGYFIMNYGIDEGEL